MNSLKAAKNMLNASLILHGIYTLLFMVGYVFQKPIWHIFGVAPEIEQMKPITAPAIVIAVVGTFVLSVWLNRVLMKKVGGAVSATLGVLTTVFCVCDFLADRMTKALSCVCYSVVGGRRDRVDYVALAAFHENSVQFLDTFLLIFFLVGLALLPCAYCVMRFGTNENNYSKG